jgi:precorrin-4 methylase
MTATVAHLPVKTPHPSPSAITAAARSLTRHGLAPEVAPDVCPDPAAASALKYEMEQLAFAETVTCALLEAPTPAQAWLGRLAR